MMLRCFECLDSMGLKKNLIGTLVRVNHHHKERSFCKLKLDVHFIIHFHLPKQDHRQIVIKMNTGVGLYPKTSAYA